MSLTVKNLKEIWNNEFLPNIRTEFRRETDSMKASISELNKKLENIRLEIRMELDPLKKKLEEIENSQKFISNQYDTVTTTVQAVKKQISETENHVKYVEDQTKMTQDRNYDLEVQLDELQQYTRRDCLEVTGIPIIPINDNPCSTACSRDVNTNWSKARKE